MEYVLKCRTIFLSNHSMYQAKNSVILHNYIIIHVAIIIALFIIRYICLLATPIVLYIVMHIQGGLG